jgi:hypothetical protein
MEPVSHLPNELNIRWYFGYRLARFAVFYAYSTTLLIHLLLPQHPGYLVLMMTVFAFLYHPIGHCHRLDLLDVGVRSLTATQLFAYM